MARLLSSALNRLDIMNSPDSGYRGRFAPSPTGPLHRGSLVAAVASYLEALSHNGEWLVRMEDVDELRNVRGAADSILRSLEAFGFEWQGEVLYQTQRKDAYEEALQALKQKQLIYPCTCSRKTLRAQAEAGELEESSLGYIYPGLCLHNDFADFHPRDYAIRIKTPDDSLAFTDRLLGHYAQQLKSELGDFIIRRRDGLFAYQLAVVVDDAYQGITHVVRGADLLDSTPRQIYLQQCLDYPSLEYTHMPLIMHNNGDKLSKQTGAEGIGHTASIPLLVQSLEFLGQQPPAELKQASLQDVWQWARQNWSLGKVR